MSSDTKYPIFNEIINEMRARPEADPVGILEEYLQPMLDVCNEVNNWLPANVSEPPWYYKFVVELARFDVDLSPIWTEVRNGHNNHL